MGGKVMIIPHEKMPTKTGCRSVSLLKIKQIMIIKTTKNTRNENLTKYRL
jgi:hypothetical protein